MLSNILLPTVTMFQDILFLYFTRSFSASVVSFWILENYEIQR
jgi:hypothetical protein